MPNIFKRLIKPILPKAAVGITHEGVAIVSLDRRRDTFTIRRAGYMTLPESLVRPSFDESNITEISELVALLAQLASSVGLSKRRRWSVALPEAATRTAILTLEGTPASHGEAEEMMRWKTERSFGVPLEELRTARQRLRPDTQGRARYLITAVRLAVLAEYETVFATLGWHAGLILPRHMGEAWWLMRDSVPSDSLLVSAHGEGFTAMLLRKGEPLMVRSIVCDEEDRADELYRFLLFYRDRMASPADDGGNASETLERLLVAGNGIHQQEARNIIEETLSVTPHILNAEDVHLALPSEDLAFDVIAAPAGLAALAWQ